MTSNKKHYTVPIISVGNLVIGGSGKTPFVISVASHFASREVTIESRGYGRRSVGLVEVSRRGEVLASVQQSGDEPMLMALSLPSASVIVSEDRGVGIDRAIELGAELIILDDGFNRVEISKLEILLEPQSLPNIMTLPSGPFREFGWSSRYAHLNLKEDIDFVRIVEYENLSPKMLLVTAIANPHRLDSYLPDGVIAEVYLADHAYFDRSKLIEMMELHGADSILTTQKDWVKMSGFKLPISLMKLKLQIKEQVFTDIRSYIDA